MTYAPEAIWDPEIGAYVVYWTSSLYPARSHFTTDRGDPKGRWPLTRNQTLFATTRDFVGFSQPGVMSGREGHGTLDAVIIRDDEDGFYSTTALCVIVFQRALALRHTGPVLRRTFTKSVRSLCWPRKRSGSWLLQVLRITR